MGIVKLPSVSEMDLINQLAKHTHIHSSRMDSLTCSQFIHILDMLLEEGYQASLRGEPPLGQNMETILDRPVLVLNRLWQAVNTCSVRRALVLLFQGHAQVVRSDAESNFYTHDFESWRDLSCDQPQPEMIHTTSVKIRIPEVIVLMLFDRLPKKEVKFTRHNVFERDKNTCQYCGEIFDRRDLNLDHVFPRDKGGQTTWENVVCSCIPCNSRKANRLPHQAGMQLIKKPKRPKWRPFVNITFPNSHHESWKHFIDFAYWNVELGN